MIGLEQPAVTQHTDPYIICSPGRKKKKNKSTAPSLSPSLNISSIGEASATQSTNGTNSGNDYLNM